MKFLPIFVFVAAVFIAGSNGGSPSFGSFSSSIFIGSSSGPFVSSQSASRSLNSMVGSSSSNSANSISNGMSSSSSNNMVSSSLSSMVGSSSKSMAGSSSANPLMSSMVGSSSARSSSSSMAGSSSSSMISSSSSRSMSPSPSNSMSSSSQGMSSSSSEPGVCYVVAQVVYEFNAFTSNVLKLYISNFHRSDDFTSMDKSEKLARMVGTVESHDRVPADDKESLRELYERGDKERGWTDQFTHDNIWDCFVGIFTGALSGVLAP